MVTCSGESLQEKPGNEKARLPAFHAAGLGTLGKQNRTKF
jgi:hypothetical protein